MAAEAGTAAIFEVYALPASATVAPVASNWIPCCCKNGRHAVCFRNTQLASDTPLQAQTAGELMRKADPKGLANAFNGHCILNESNIERIRSAAKLLELIELEADMMAVFGALEGGPDQQGWFVTTGEGSPYLLAVNSGELDGQRFNICSVSNPFLTASIAIEAWLSNAGMVTLISDETRFGQRERAWEITDWIDGALVYSVEGVQTTKGGITLSLLAPETD